MTGTKTAQPEAAETEVKVEEMATVVEPPAQEQPAEERKPRFKLMLTPRMRQLAQLGAAIIFVTASLMLALRSIEPTVSIDEVTRARTNAEPAVEIGDGMVAAELLELAGDASSRGHMETAERLLEEARVRVHAGDQALEIAIFEALAFTADAMDRPDVAGLHREHAASLRLKLGSVLRYFSEGERMLSEGHPATARRYFSEFLLRADDLTNDSSQYVEKAREHIAAIWVAEVMTSKDAQPLHFDVEEVIHE